jgi:hypothetical protein
MIVFLRDLTIFIPYSQLDFGEKSDTKGRSQTKPKDTFSGKGRLGLLAESNSRRARLNSRLSQATTTWKHSKTSKSCSRYSTLITSRMLL